jgi:hypothetical protein
MTTSSMVAGVLNTLDPQAGQGVTESIIAIMLIAGLFALIWTGKEVPETVTVAVSVVFGFYFGSKAVTNGKP